MNPKIHPLFDFVYITLKFLFPLLVIAQQFTSIGGIPTIAVAAFMFYLRYIVFDDTVAPAEYWTAIVQRIETRPKRLTRFSFLTRNYPIILFPIFVGKEFVTKSFYLIFLIFTKEDFCWRVKFKINHILSLF